MQQAIVSSREIQRNYRGLIEKVKRSKTPLYLGAHRDPEVVLLDVEVFEKLMDQASGRSSNWSETKKQLQRIRAGGRQDVILADFIRTDRLSHDIS